MKRRRRKTIEPSSPPAAMLLSGARIETGADQCGASNSQPSSNKTRELYDIGNKRQPARANQSSSLSTNLIGTKYFYIASLENKGHSNGSCSLFEYPSELGKQLVSFEKAYILAKYSLPIIILLTFIATSTNCINASEPVVISGYRPSAGENNSRAAANESSLQRYLGRHDFGKRLQVFNPANLNQTYGGSPINNDSSHILAKRRDYEITKPTDSSADKRSVDSIISNLFKFRPQLRPSPLIDSLIKLTSQNHHRLVSVGNSIGVSAGSADVGNQSDPYYNQFIINESLTSSAAENDSIQSESSSVMGTNSNWSSPLSNHRLNKDFQVVSVRDPSSHSLVTSNGVGFVLKNDDNNTRIPEESANIEQIIKDVKEEEEDNESKDSHGDKSNKYGNKSRHVEGEHLKDYENNSHWKKEKKGEEEKLEKGKNDMKKNSNFIKDLGHNKHGWKNVYHKEEYAQHQKFHDVFQDKDWNNSRSKMEENFRLQKGNKFHDSNSNMEYDKDKYHTKYDYSKGSEWKRQEDDDGSVLSLNNKQANNNDREQASNINQQREKLYQAEPSQQHDDQHESEHIDDEAVIEQMKERLNRLSEPQQYSHHNNQYHNPHNQPHQGNYMTSQSLNRNYSREHPNDQSQERHPAAAAVAEAADRAKSHQSINDILKTAKKINNSTAYKANETSTTNDDNDDDGEHESGSSDNDNDGDNEDSNEQQVANLKPKSVSSSAITTTTTTNENRDNKNQLRLKLELDLGKTINQKKKTTNPKVNKTITTTPPPNLLRPFKVSKNAAVSGWEPKDDLHHDQPFKWTNKMPNYMSKPMQDHRVNQYGGLQQVIKSPPSRYAKQSSAREFKPSRQKSMGEPMKSLISNDHISRPIVIKHLEMNNGILVDSNNRSNPFQGSHNFHSDDSNVESSLANALGDFNHQAQPLELPIERAPKDREFMILFGSEAVRLNGHEPAPSDEHYKISHQPVEEPNVIFEASASTIEPETLPHYEVGPALPQPPPTGGFFSEPNLYEQEDRYRSNLMKAASSMNYPAMLVKSEPVPFVHQARVPVRTHSQLAGQQPSSAMQQAFERIKFKFPKVFSTASSAYYNPKWIPLVSSFKFRPTFNRNFALLTPRPKLKAQQSMDHYSSQVKTNPKSNYDDFMDHMSLSMAASNIAQSYVLPSSPLKASSQVVVPGQSMLLQQQQFKLAYPALDQQMNFTTGFRPITPLQPKWVPAKLVVPKPESMHHNSSIRPDTIKFGQRVHKKQLNSSKSKQHRQQFNKDKSGGKKRKRKQPQLGSRLQISDDLDFLEVSSSKLKPIYFVTQAKSSSSSRLNTTKLKIFENLWNKLTKI